MNKYFLLVCFSVFLAFYTTKGFAQDIITTGTGEEIKSKILTLNKKGVTFKKYEDPEFSTYTIPYKELKTIKKENDKHTIQFNHKLPRGYIVFNLGTPGTAIPLGALGRSTYENFKSEPGFAKREGVSIKVDAAFYIKKRVGLSFSVGQFFYKFDYDKYSDALLGDNPPVYPLTNYRLIEAYSGTNTHRTLFEKKASYNTWIFSHFYIGPCYSLRIGKNITYDINARIGTVNITKPAILVRIKNFNSSTGQVTDAEFQYENASKTALGFNLGTNIRYKLSNRFALFAAANYNRIQTSITYNVQNNTGASYSKISTDYTFSSLNLSLGLAYQFKRKANKYE